MEMNRTVGRNLFLASTLSLFVELLLIRWIPNTFHIVAFFNNLVLIGCFLGLGIGFIRKAPPSAAVRSAFICLAILTIAIAALDILNPVVRVPAGSDYAVNEIQPRQPFSIPVQPLLVGVFVLAVIGMVPFGQLVAAYFEQLPALRAYSLNIAGSLAGVILFSIVCWLWVPPLGWYAIAFLFLLILDRSWKYLIPAALMMIALVAVDQKDSSRPGTWLRWSPYYKVIARPIHPEWTNLNDGFTVTVNDQFLLSGLDLRQNSPLLQKVPADLANFLNALRSYYEFPFRLNHFQRVLILGAGAGNDTAAALRLGVKHVTAVELDPCVIAIGRKYHPEKPYDSETVTLLQEDARAFLRRSNEKFDLIIFATLDAHGLLSQMGNVRLDSFVYTEDSFREARKLLAPGGFLVLSFGPFREDIQYRQLATLTSVFGQTPLYLEHTNKHRTIVAGPVNQIRWQKPPESWRVIGPQEIAGKFNRYPYARIFATDNWPHLYIREHRIPREYQMVLILILAVSALMLAWNFRKSFRFEGHFFFLGAAFLLLETKSVTEFALLVGSTWVVNAVVFSAILLTILISNFLAGKIQDRIPMIIWYALLILGLILSYVAPVSLWARPGSLIDLCLASLFAAFPILMAGIIFARSLQQTTDPILALASNLLGAVLGGTTEYFSIVFGIRALALLALSFYVISFLFSRRSLRPAV